MDRARKYFSKWFNMEESIFINWGKFSMYNLRIILNSAAIKQKNVS